MGNSWPSHLTVVSLKACCGAVPQMWGILMRVLGSRAIAEDALQDAFMRIWQQAAQFEPIKGRTLSWMVAIARNRAIEVQRARRPTVLLGAAQRQCLLLAYQRGLTGDNIALSIDRPLGSVKNWVRRGLQSLMACLAS